MCVCELDGAEGYSSRSVVPWVSGAGPPLCAAITLAPRPARGRLSGEARYLHGSGHSVLRSHSCLFLPVKKGLHIGNPARRREREGAGAVRLQAWPGCTVSVAYSHANERPCRCRRRRARGIGRAAPSLSPPVLKEPRQASARITGRCGVSP